MATIGIESDSIEYFTISDECIAFLKRQAQQIGLPIEIHHPFDETKPIAIITWLGTDPSLSSIILNSHMDVVPVYEELWTHPPFGADMDENGRIFARGSQDMKSVGMQYLGAINALKSKGVRLKRTIHITFVPGKFELYLWLHGNDCCVIKNVLFAFFSGNFTASFR